MFNLLAVWRKPVPQATTLTCAEAARNLTRRALDRALERRIGLETARLRIEAEISELNVVIESLSPACEKMSVGTALLELEVNDDE